MTYQKSPEYYHFQPSLKPHLFTGLDRFAAGRIHQMRAGKSYLAAQRPRSLPASPTCPSCLLAEEDMTHAILECPACSQARLADIPLLESVALDSPLWNNIDSLHGLTRYLHVTKTSYPYNPSIEILYDSPLSSGPSSPNSPIRG